MHAAELLRTITIEVEELHEVFVRWFGNDLDNLDRVETVLGDNFSIVMPDGSLVGREPLMTSLRAGRGSRDVAIEVRNVALRWQHGDVAIATYEEWQHEAGRTTGRLSTVVFSVAEAAPNGLCWEHVHETWLQAPP